MSSPIPTATQAADWLTAAGPPPAAWMGVCSSGVTGSASASPADTKGARCGWVGMRDGWMDGCRGVKNGWRNKACRVEVGYRSGGGGFRGEKNKSSGGWLINWAFIYHNSCNGRRRLTREERKTDYQHIIPQYISWPTARSPERNPFILVLQKRRWRKDDFHSFIPRLLRDRPLSSENFPVT